jgi:hypothetical protein
VVLAAVFCERSDAYECCDFSPAEVTEFGKIDQQSSRNTRPDARSGLQQLGKLRSIDILFDALVDLLIDSLDLALEHTKHRSDGSLHGSCDCFSTILFRYERRDQLPAAGDEIGQQTVSSLQNRANRWLHLLAVEGQELGIDRIRLGEHPHALAEASHAPGIDHDDGQVRFREFEHEFTLVATGGFHDDPLGFYSDHALHKRCNTARLVSRFLNLP